MNTFEIELLKNMVDSKQNNRYKMIGNNIKSFKKVYPFLYKICDKNNLKFAGAIRILKKDIKCPECKGNGDIPQYVKMDCDLKTCKICNGSGYMPII